MGILDKLSDMRKRVDEDWREDARAAKAAKWVKDFHRNRLEKLNFNIDTSFGEFKLNIHPNWKGGPELRVYLGDDYLFYENFENVKELKDFIENKLTDEIYECVREKFYYKIQKMPRDEAKSVLKRFDGLLDELDKGIELEIDFDKLEKDLHRYGVYSRALNDRSSNKSDLENRAKRNFEKEHGFEVGDVVYGTHRSDLRDGKAYVITEIEKNGKIKDYWKYKVKPENGRGQGGTAYGYQLYLDSDITDAAVNNPDDPKYNKEFDQQEYMMNRYSNGDDAEFNEAVKTLENVGMIVEKVK
jgi:hypothetical protein